MSNSIHHSNAIHNNSSELSSLILPPSSFTYDTKHQILFTRLRTNDASSEDGHNIQTTTATGSPNFVPDMLSPEEDKLLRDISVGGITFYVNELQHTTKTTAPAQHSSGSTNNNNNNDAEHVKRQSMYFSAVVPGISNENYVKRLGRFLSVPSYVYVTAFIFLNKLSEDSYFQHLRLSPENTHRLLITAVYTAAKILTPGLEQVSALHFSRVGGTRSVDEMERLERTFSVFMAQLGRGAGNHNGYMVTREEFKTMMTKLWECSNQASAEAERQKQVRLQEEQSKVTSVDSKDSIHNGQHGQPQQEQHLTSRCAHHDAGVPQVGGRASRDQGVS